MKGSRNSTGRVHRLYRLLVTSGMSFEETCQAVLREGVNALGVSYGLLSRSDGVTETVIYMFPAETGMHEYRTSDVKQTFCLVAPPTREQGSTGAGCGHRYFKDTDGEAGLNTVRHVFGSPGPGGVSRGAVVFSSGDIRHRFSADDHEYVRLIADGIRALYDRKIREDEKEHTLQALMKNNDILESIFRNATIGMALVLPSGQWMKVNHSLVRMLGYSEDYLLSVTFQNITHPDDLRNDLQHLDALSQGSIPSYQLEKRYLTASGEWIWILLSVSLVREDNSEVRYYIAQIQSIEEQKKMALALESQKEALRKANILLEQIAAEDCLTGVASRRQFMRWFDDVVADLKEQPAPLSLVIADIDFFKIYNDSFGHPEGDIALRAVARTLSDTLRQRDRLARFGGEEFIILLPETDEHGCFQVCERLRKQTEEIATLRKTVTLSLGAVTWLPEEGKPVIFDELLRMADGKLYDAKRGGRNCVRVSRL